MNDVRNELGISGAISLGQTEVRNLAKIPSGRISMSDLRGKSSGPTTPQDCDYYFETIEDFNARRDGIIAENNNDLSQKTFGFGDGVTMLFPFFAYSSITSTPKMIIAKNVTNAGRCFYNCNQLKIIQKQLFYNCNNINSFEECFEFCFDLQSISEGIFDKNIKATNFNGCFSACTDIVEVPFNLFDKNVNATIFSRCFSDCSKITSALPDVWNKAKFPKVTDGTNYANSCEKAANYNEIPSTFK